MKHDEKNCQNYCFNFMLVTFFGLHVWDLSVPYQAVGLLPNKSPVLQLSSRLALACSDAFTAQTQDSASLFLLLTFL